MTYTDDTLMPFGAHKDTKLADVPAHYLLWLGKQDWLEEQDANLLDYIEDNKEILEDEIKRDFRY